MQRSLMLTDLAIIHQWKCLVRRLFLPKTYTTRVPFFLAFIVKNCLFDQKRQRQLFFIHKTHVKVGLDSDTVS